MDKPKPPKAECKGCQARDKIIEILANEIDRLSNVKKEVREKLEIQLKKIA
jgi:hypothetical protein